MAKVVFLIDWEKLPPPVEKRGGKTKRARWILFWIFKFELTVQKDYENFRQASEQISKM